jgi:hypothetical protein
MVNSFQLTRSARLSLTHQKDAKDAKNAQILSPIGWRPSPAFGFSPIFAPFAIFCSRLSPSCSRFPRTAREGERDSVSKPDHVHVQQKVELASRPLRALSVRLTPTYVERLLAPARTKPARRDHSSAFNGATIWKAEFHVETEGR